MSGTPTQSGRRPVVVRSEFLIRLLIYSYVELCLFFCTDGVIGCQLATGLVEESNFHISEVRMKIKVRGMEAGWIVSVSEVTGEQTNQ